MRSLHIAAREEPLLSATREAHAAVKTQHNQKLDEWVKLFKKQTCLVREIARIVDFRAERDLGGSQPHPLFSRAENCGWIQRVLSLIRSIFFFFTLFSVTLEDGSKKMLLQFMPKCILPMVSSKSFIVFSLTFRPLSHFEFFCVCS